MKTTTDEPVVEGWYALFSKGTFGSFAKIEKDQNGWLVLDGHWCDWPDMVKFGYRRSVEPYPVPVMDE